MATTANIFTLKLENKDFNAQLQTAAKTSQDYNNKIANSLLEAARQQTVLIGLTKEKAEAQLRGDKSSIASLNQQIAATKSLIQVENQKIAQSKISISSQVEEAKKLIALDGEQIRSKSSLTSAIQKRNEVLNSLGAQRVSEEKARYQTLSSLAAQKTKEASATGDLRTGFESSYVNTGAQNKYNASLVELNNLKSQGIISEGEYTKALKKSHEALKQGAPERDNQFNHMIRMMRWAGTLAAAFYGVKTAWDATLGIGLEVTAQFEQMQIGISALIATNSQDVTAMGKHVTASQKFAMAQRDAADAIIMLRKANIDTPATLEQLTRGFQSALGPAMSLGFNLKQTVEYSKLMTLAASALTVPMEQLAQETRSILNGTIDQNSIVAVSLGITNAQIKAHKEQGDVYEFLISKLTDFNAAGNAVNKSWAGIASNLSDSWRAFTSDVAVSTGLFAGLKTVMGELTTVLKNQNGELDTASRYLTNAGIVAGTFYGVILAGRGVQALRDIAWATNVATVSQIRLNTAVKLNPWVAVATVIGAATLALMEYKNLSDQISASNAKTAGSMGFMEDLKFISGKGKAQQVHDLVAKSKELREEEIKLRILRKNDALFVAGVEIYTTDAHKKRMTEAKERIAAIAEEQHAIKKYLATPGARGTVKPIDGLISKPKEKTAEELAKEQKAADKLIAEADRKELSDLEKLKAHFASINAQLELNATNKILNGYVVKDAKLTDIQKNRLAEFSQEQVLLQKNIDADSQLTNEKNRQYKIDQDTVKLLESKQAQSTYILGLQRDETAELEKQSLLSDKWAAKAFENDAKLADLQMRRNREAPNFERTFGTSKISQGTADAEIQQRKNIFALDMKDVSPLSDTFKIEEIKLEQIIERIKNQIVEIPPIDLKINLEGWDTFSSGMAGIITTVDGLNKSTITYTETLKVLETKRDTLEKGSKEEAQNNKDLANLKANNSQDELATYASLTHAVSTFAKVGSKEQRALLQVEQGIHMAKMAMAIGTMITDTTVTAVSVANSSTRATADGTAAIAKTMSSVPYPYNLIAGALVAASLVSAGVTLFGGGGSGGSSTPPPPVNSGTVLGDISAVSESTTKLSDLMSSIHVAEYSELRDINRAVTSMAQGIESAVTGIFRTGILDTSGVSLKSSGIALTDAMTPDLKTFITDPLKVMTNLTKSVFGGTKSQYIAGSGFNIGEGTLGEKASGNVGASTFVDVETMKKKAWGSTSYSHSITTTALDQASAQSISLVYGSFRDAMLEVNKGLGTNLAPAISNYTLDAIKLNLQGKTGEESVKALNDAFSAMGDKMASDVFGPVIDQYQKLGEGLLETAVRVITEKAVVIQDLGDIGKTVNGDIISVSQSLVTLSGSLGDFQDSVASYYDKYFSDTEKQLRSQEKLSTLFGDLNLALPMSNQGFRQLVDAVDLTTLSGQETFTTLMSVSGAFSEFSAKVLEGFNAEKSNALELAALQRTLVDEQKTALNTAIDAAKTLLASFSGIITSIETTMSELVKSTSGTTQRGLIASFWEKRAQLDLILSKNGNLTTAEANQMQTLVGELGTLSTSIQSGTLGDKTGITGSLVGELGSIRDELRLDEKILTVQIVDAGGTVVNTSTEGTLSLLAKAITTYNANIEASLQVSSSNLSFADFKAGGLLTTADEIAFRQSFVAESAVSYKPELEALRENLSYMALATTDVPKFLLDLKKVDSTGLGNVLEFVKSLGSGDAWVSTLKTSTASEVSNASAMVDWNKGQDSIKYAAGLNAIHDLEVKQVATMNAYATEANRLAALQGGAWRSNEYAAAMSAYVSTSSDRAVTVQNWTNTKNAGVVTSQETKDALATLISAQGLYASLPSFAVGTPYVTQDMTANIHRGEMVIDEQASRALRKYGIPNPSNNSGYDTRPILGSIYNTLEDMSGYLKRLDKNFETVMQGNRLRTVV